MCAHIGLFLFTASEEVLKDWDEFPPDGEEVEIKREPKKTCLPETVYKFEYH